MVEKTNCRSIRKIGKPNFDRLERDRRCGWVGKLVGLKDEKQEENEREVRVRLVWNESACYHNDDNQSN